MFLGKKLTCHAETGKKQDSKEVQVTLTKISNTRGNKTITTPLAHENSEVCKSLHGSTKLSAWTMKKKFTEQDPNSLSSNYVSHA